MSQTIVVTGHRKLAGSYYPNSLWHVLYQSTLDILRRHREKYDGDTRLITGMALGFDMLCAQTALEVGFRVVPYVPFVGQDSRWPPDSVSLYNSILSAADPAVICSTGGYTVGAMFKRNLMMMEQLGEGDLLLSLWDGKKSGGTYGALREAHLVRATIPFHWVNAPESHDMHYVTGDWATV